MTWVKNKIRNIAYFSGFLGLFHRIRNAKTLTVFMFHRVLPAESKEYSCAEREFTFSVNGFSACLDFIQKNYEVVSHNDIKAWLSGGLRLPNCAALITFDDGWRDTVQYALPELQKRALPSVLFLATEVSELGEDRWWQDMLVEALAQSGGLESIERDMVLRDDVMHSDRRGRIMRVTAALAESEDSVRHQVLKKKVFATELSRQMVTAVDIASIPFECSIAGHGHSHAPLSYSADSLIDLRRSKERLMGLKADDWAMSLPHGAFNSEVVNNVFEAGFAACYSSEPMIMNTSSIPGGAALLPRIHVPENKWTCDSGRISEPMLATYLFFRPITQ